MARRILIAEDDPALRRLYRAWLKPTGAEIEEATDGRDALSKVRAQPPDLLLCDVFMPNMDGLELIRSVAKEFRSVKAIALSGGGGMFDAGGMLTAARDFGAAAQLPKPFTASELLATVEQVLQQD